MACVEISPEDFDDMHHALGRPADPAATTHRNYYCTDADGAQARHFADLGLWTLVRKINGGRDAIFAVNADGRSALADWLKLKQIEKGLSTWAVFGGCLIDRHMVIAKSASAARYRVYLDLDLSFGGFGQFVKSGVQAVRV